MRCPCIIAMVLTVSDGANTVRTHASAGGVGGHAIVPRVSHGGSTMVAVLWWPWLCVHVTC